MVYGVEISPDSRQIAVGTSTGVYLYDRITTQQIGFINLPIASDVKYNECNLQEKNIAFSSDGKYLAIADVHINIWDLSTNKLYKTIVNKVDNPSSIITEIKFSPNGDRIVTLQKDRFVGYPCYIGWRSFLIYNVNNGELVFRQDFTGNDEFARFFRFDKNEVVNFLNPTTNGLEVLSSDLTGGNTIKQEVIETNYSADVEGSVITYWEMENNKVVTTHLIDLLTNNDIRTIPDQATILPSAQYVLIGKQNFTLETLKGDQICSFSNTYGVYSHKLVSFTKDESIGISWDDDRGEVRVWDFKRCLVSESILFFQEIARKMKFSPDGKSLLTGSLGGYSYHVLDVQTGLGRYTIQGVYDAEFSADGNSIIVLAGETLDAYDVETGLLLKPILKVEEESLGASLIVSPDGNTIALRRSGTSHVKVLNLQDGSEITNISDTNNWQTVFNKKGNLLAVVRSAADGTEVKFWNVITGQELDNWHGLLPYGLPVVFNKDLSMLASIDENKVYLWGIPEFSIDKILDPTDIYGQHIAGGLTFSPDSKLLVGLGHDPNEILFWNVETGQFLYKIPTSETYLELGYYIDLSPDGRLLATMGNHGTIQILGVKKP